MFHCYAIYSIGVVLTFGAMEGRSLVFFGYLYKLLSIVNCLFYSVGFSKFYKNSFFYVKIAYYARKNYHLTEF